MKEAIVSPDLSVEIVDSPIPVPGPNQVVIRVAYAGTNPKDWKWPVLFKATANSGDDMAGIIHEVGSDVYEFKVGDRVAAMHEFHTSPGGSFAEYAMAPAHTTFHLPNNISFAEGATIPIAALSAALALYANLALPYPWQPATTPIPLIIYGASSAVGTFAIKLAQLSNIHPLICVAGKGASFVETLIDRSKGDEIVDYRGGPEKIVEEIEVAVKKVGFSEIKHGLDAVTTHPSWLTTAKAMASGGTITPVLLSPDFSGIPKEINNRPLFLPAVHQAKKDDTGLAEKARQGAVTGAQELGFLFLRFFGWALQQGWLTPHPYREMPGGLSAVQEALTNLKEGKNSAFKYVIKISDI